MQRKKSSEPRRSSGKSSSKKTTSRSISEKGKFTDKKKGKQTNDRYSKSDSDYSGKEKYGNRKDEKKPFDKKRSDSKFSKSDKPFDKKRSDSKYSKSDKPYDKKISEGKYSKTDKPFDVKKKKFNPNDDLDDSNFTVDDYQEKKKSYLRDKKPYQSLPYRKKKTAKQVKREDDGTLRLNKYLSNAGICSRREADQLIESGVIKVNGKVVTELGTRIFPTDKVSYGDQTVRSETLVYLLLNKPKDYITTVDDPNKRRTVMELIKGAVKQRVYPVGRLDRNTTGLLLFTNDGELTLKLTHPKNDVRKIYHVVTDKNVAREDMEQLRNGIELEDGFIKPDDVQFVGEGHNKKDIGVEIHSGKNRVVRRMFEHLDYKVIKLDRVMFAGLTKKDLPRGKWRLLTTKEINFLKMK